MSENATQFEERIVPVSSLTVVKRDHPLAKDFYTPRNDKKPSADTVATIKTKGRPDYPIHVFPVVYDENGTQRQAAIVLDGNQRYINTVAAELSTIPVIVRSDLTYEGAVALAARLNSHREDNDIATNMLLAARLIKPDATGKPQAMSYEEAGQQFKKSHTFMRQLIQMHLFFTPKMKKALNDGKLSFTAATSLLRKELLDDPERLSAAFDELLSDDGALSVDGKVKKGAYERKNKDVKLAGSALTKNEWRLLARAKDTPMEASLLIEIFVGDKPFDAGVKNGLDWMVKPVKEAKPKKEKKAKTDKSAKKEAKATEVSADALTDVDVLFS